MMTQFTEVYQCHPLSLTGQLHLEKGDKIIMPPSALLRLSLTKVEYPMSFRLVNPYAQKVTHCGVMEFTAKEGTVLLPNWVMQNMNLLEGDPVLIKNVSLKKATFVKLRPHEKAFVELSNPKAVLERTLRGFSCLTVGDTIVIHYNDKKFCIDVLETGPDDKAVSIVETDCEVDFAPPLDYKEPEKAATRTVAMAEDRAEKMKMQEGDGEKEEVKFRVFERASNESKKEASKQEHGFKPFTGKSYKLSD